MEVYLTDGMRGDGANRKGLAGRCSWGDVSGRHIGQVRCFTREGEAVIDM